MLISFPEIESKTVFINAVETPCKIKYTSGPLGGCLWLDQDVPENSIVEVWKERTKDTLRNVRKIGPGVYSCDITWGIFTST
jgi:hypothetical protein